MHGVLRNEHTPIPGTVAYAEWRRGLYLLINVLLSNGLGTGYKKILKKYLMTRIITTIKKTLLSDKELDCDIHLGSAEQEGGRKRWESMQWWVHTI